MAANDEVFKLILDLGGSAADAQALVDKLKDLGSSALKVKESYDVLERQVGTYSVSTAQVATAEDKAVAEAVELTRAQKALADAYTVTAAKAEVAADKTEKVGSKLAGTSQSLLQTGRVVQDFAQGGIGGILNNIEGLSLALGGGAGLAGVLTILGVAAFVAGPQIKAFWDSLTEGFKEKVPGAIDELGKFTEAIKKNKEELEDLKKKQTLTILEGEKYRDLVMETTKLEEEQANARAASRSVSPYDNKADRARASAFREALGEFGGGEKLVQSLIDKGFDRPESEYQIATALKGDANQIANLQSRAAGFQKFYTSPEETQRRKDEAKQRKDDFEMAQRGLKDEAEFDERRKRRQAEAQKLQDQADAADRAAEQKAEQKAEKESEKANKLKPMSKGELARGDRNLWQIEAGNIEADVIRQGFATQRQEAMLNQLQKKLGTDMPQFEEVQQVMQAVQNGLIKNQGTFGQRLIAAKQAIRRVEQITTQQGQPAATVGFTN